MDRMLYIAMAGAKQTMRSQAVNANNLANINTTGFRADLEAIKTVNVYGDGYQSRAYSQSFHSGVKFTAGITMTTGRSLDIALSDKGYLAVQGPDGREAYTRAGNLRITANGQLQTVNGFPVMGNSGPISIPPYQKLEIGRDGTITVQPLGQSAAALSVVDRIRVVKPDESKLTKNAQGLLVLPLGSIEPAPDPKVQVYSGRLESSNVNAVGALINMIDLARQFEMNVKMMRTAEQNESAVTQLMRMS